MGTIEEVAPGGLSLPVWPTEPEPVDATGTSYLLLGFGPEGGSVVDTWARDVSGLGPADLVRSARFDPAAVTAALASTRCGVRIMVAGPQDDVLLTLAAARESGAEPEELRSFVTRTDVLPVFCAHCRATSSVEAVPGGVAVCPACATLLDVHPHLSAVRGSFLGSDTTARELT